jgi:hypothetical protein
VKIEISIEETVKILKFHSKYTRKLEHGDVDPIDDSIKVKDFVQEFLKNRGIRKPKVYNHGIHVFGNVGMHIDTLSPKSAMTLCLMISGWGKLFAWNGKRINECYLSKGEGVIFDFNLPHSFEAEKQCQAFLIDIPKKYKKNFIIR